MIKIIKEGKTLKKTKYIYTITCPHCGCVFECENSDFETLSRGTLSKGLDSGMSIYCPFCKNLITGSRNTLEYKIEEF